MDILTAIELGCAVVTAASGICALTPTPDPGTAWGKLYRGIELLALVVGRAKERGIVPVNRAVDALAADALKVAGDVLGKGGSGT